MDHLKSLFEKYKNNKGTPEQMEELLDIFADAKSENFVLEYIAESLNEPVADTAELDQSVDEVYRNLTKKIFHPSGLQQKSSRIMLWKRYAIAASIFLGIALASLFFYKTYHHTSGPDYANDISPVKSGVTLTLASGRKISLNDVANGELASESGISISKTNEGKLIYSIKANTNDDVSLNTLSTGKGEVYQVKLPDGSLVWLNALSSLTYPAALRENGSRRVKLEGEAYFEVARDSRHPFIVTSGGQQVRVLGTHFNIKSYGAQEDVRTTLLEGSVRVSPLLTSSAIANATSLGKVIKPGEQSLWKGNKLEIRSVDTLDVVGWRNGDFIFKEESLENVMLEVARWYDVEIVYEKDYPKKVVLGGLVSRSKNISAVLRLVEATGKVHFKLKGKIVTVSK